MLCVSPSLQFHDYPSFPATSSPMSSHLSRQIRRVNSLIHSPSRLFVLSFRPFSLCGECPHGSPVPRLAALGASESLCAESITLRAQVTKPWLASGFLDLFGEWGSMRAPPGWRHLAGRVRVTGSDVVIVDNGGG